MRLKKEITLKEIMFLHQSDLEALESSNEICQSKHTNLKSNHHKTNETIKTNKKRYKQGKVIAKGKLYVRQTQRVRMKDNQENKELNEKSRHTKEYLRKSTRVDEENKKFSYWNFYFFFMQTVFDIH